MKRLTALFLSLLMVMSVVSAASDGYTTLYAEDGRHAEFRNDVVEAQLKVGWSLPALPFNGEMDMYFSSGVGGWGTSLKLKIDGTFTGYYSDSDMGATGYGYPNGMCYVSKFSGKFTDIRQIDANTYSMKLSNISYTYEVGDSWIENGILYVASAAHGIDPGNEFIFYTPGVSIDKLNEDFVWWWGSYTYEGAQDKLTTYGLYNVNSDGDFGFFK